MGSAGVSELDVMDFKSWEAGKTLVGAAFSYRYRAGPSRI